jgi:hypothetical protein
MVFESELVVAGGQGSHILKVSITEKQMYFIGSQEAEKKDPRFRG